MACDEAVGEEVEAVGDIEVVEVEADIKDVMTVCAVAVEVGEVAVVVQEVAAKRPG